MNNEPLSKEEIDSLNNTYRELLNDLSPLIKRGETKIIRKAYDTVKYLTNIERFPNGTPYATFPLEVAKISCKNIGLGTVSFIASLLFPLVEQKLISLEDIQEDYGIKTKEVIVGIIKIQSFSYEKIKTQTDNFRKLLLYLSGDVRVILITLAIRLYKLRNTQHFDHSQSASDVEETIAIYIPLAHRLGLYSIKTEMEDLAMKFNHTELYNSINEKLQASEIEREKFVNEFIKPISDSLNQHKFKFNIKWRTKSVFSIWNKMKKQGVEFEEVYDIFAIRVVINTSKTNEKTDCWKVYSIVTDIYPPNPKRLRDWISIPKSNGYESLHTTVMSKSGKWVEIQIRTHRMDEIAEMGFASHWRYKEKNQGEDFDEKWLKNLRELLENPDLQTIDFIDFFKLNLESKEVFVFKPKGDMKKLPAGSTVLDFAFEIHTNVGEKCIGAKVNNKMVPVRYVLQNGDQVKIITLKSAKPNQDWLNHVITAKAKTRIKKLIDEEKFRNQEAGKELIQRRLKNWKLPFDESIQKLMNHFRFKNISDIYYHVGADKINIIEIKSLLDLENEELSEESSHDSKQEQVTEDEKTEFVYLGEEIKNVNYQYAKCCNPIFGDEVFGFVKVGKGITIHRKNCPNAIEMQERFDYRIIQVKWGKPVENNAFQADIKVTGEDKLGMLNSISQVISNDLKMNMRSIKLDTNKGFFEGFIKVYVNSQNQLKILLRKIMEIDGVQKAHRIDNE